MKNTLSLLFAGIIVSPFAFGQITDAEKNLRSASTDTINGWKKGGVIGVSVSQASFTNWAAGGQNSLSLNGLVSVYANYKKEKSSWDNMLDLGYGLLRQGKKGDFIKTDDKIDFSSKYGRVASEHWNYAVLLSFKTQMTEGYNYPNDSVEISGFLAPAYLLGALGMDYKPNDNFSAFIAPVTIKTTIVNHQRLADAGEYGVEPAEYDTAGNLVSSGKMIRNEFGGYLRVVYKNTFFKDESVSLLTKLDIFSNYLHNPQNMDVSWETVFAFKVNKYISATLTTHLLYDDDIDIAVDSNGDGIIEATGPRTQFKQVLAIGFSYKF